MKNKTFIIQTFGCQMNKNDSELMSVSLKKTGFKEAAHPSEANIFIFNTCSVREHAEERAISRIESIRKEVLAKNGLVILVGCMAQRKGREFLQDGLADLAIGPYQAPKIGELLKVYLDDKERDLFISQKKADLENRVNADLISEQNDNQWHKFVSITHGCDNYCSYCIVPYVRGELVSFPSKDILEYINLLSQNGIREITLLGQNVNQFGLNSDDIPFYKLLEQVAKIKGLIKINFLTSHPKDFNLDTVKVIKDYPNISRGIHLPLQSGSDEILALMRRDYDLNHFLKIVEILDKELGSYSLTTDLIVGFPGEEEDNYQETLEAVRKIQFDDAFTYIYSPRVGTPAADLDDDLGKKEKIRRLQKLIKTQRHIGQKKLKARIDQIEEVIVEKISKRSLVRVFGKTLLNHPIIVSGSSKDIGQKIKVKVVDLIGSTLIGKKVV
jgi:tRNA-2-methylthio-N6-dimethylallyladenosine synthase